jgi:hypothetical protein
VPRRIEFKVALLAYKYLHGAGPAYLTGYRTMLTPADRHHQLRSVSTDDFPCKNFAKKSMGF